MAGSGATPQEINNQLNGPAGVPPAGVQPFSTKSDNLTGALIGTIVPCLVITTGLVGVRLYTRLVVMHRHDASDYTLVISWGALVAFTGLLFKFQSYGGGYHAWDITLEDAIDLSYWFLTVAMTYDISIIMIKVSILTQYRKIFVATQRYDFMRISTWALTVIVVVFYVTAGLIQAFFCMPVGKSWNPTLEGRCLDENPDRLNVIAGSFNIAIDVILLVLPLLAISRLQLSQKQKLAVSSIFLVGIFACVAAAMRLYSSWLLGSTADTSYNAMKLGLWAYAETVCGIVCVCMPLMPRFMQKAVFERAFYLRITSSLRSMLSSSNIRSSELDSNDRSHDNYRSNHYNPSTQRGKSANSKTSKPHTLGSSSRGGSEELEMTHQDPQKYTSGGGIMRTVDIETARA